MAYDERLAERIRTAMEDVPEVAEIAMFGGLCFTVRGNMAVGLNGTDLMVRLDPDEHDAALAEPHARPMDFTGRPMRGFLYVDAAGTRSGAGLRKWVRRGVAYASALPPKRPRKRTTASRAKTARRRSR
jgi:TfoX/Sxy family transcriptional regulator of competence genes